MYYFGYTDILAVGYLCIHLCMHFHRKKQTKKTYAAVVAGDLDRYLAVQPYLAQPRGRIWSHCTWNALYYKGCYPWKTLKFEIFSENRKTDAGGDNKLWIQFSPASSPIRRMQICRKVDIWNCRWSLPIQNIFEGVTTDTLQNMMLLIKAGSLTLTDVQWLLYHGCY